MNESPRTDHLFKRPRKRSDFGVYMLVAFLAGLLLLVGPSILLALLNDSFRAIDPI